MYNNIPLWPSALDHMALINASHVQFNEFAKTLTRKIYTEKKRKNRQ